MGYDNDLFQDDGSERVPDDRPGPMFAGVDRYFDEPERSDGRAAGLLAWAARANAAQRSGLARFAAWMASAPDGERRVILVLFGEFQGRTPRGVINDCAALAGVSRDTVQRAVRRFGEYLPGVLPELRGRTETGRERDRTRNPNGRGARRGDAG